MPTSRKVDRIIGREARSLIDKVSHRMAPWWKSVNTALTENAPPDNMPLGAPTVQVNFRARRLSNLFYRLIGRRSISRGWIREGTPSLDFDFDRLTLSGIELKRPVTDLECLGLGPADEYLREDCRGLNYNDLGLTVAASDLGGIYYVRLKWWDFKQSPLMWCDSTQHHPFAGTLRSQGQLVSLTKLTRRDSIIEQFGEPHIRYDEDEFSQLAYKTSHGQYAFLFEPHQLNELTLSTLMVTPTA